jgi:hypothetical protein
VTSPALGTRDVHTDLFDDDLDRVASALDEQVRHSGADLWPRASAMGAEDASDWSGPSAPPADETNGRPTL